MVDERDGCRRGWCPAGDARLDWHTLVVALAVPGAFGDDAVQFGVAYFLVRHLHLVLSAIAGRGDPNRRERASPVRPDPRSSVPRCSC